MSKIIYDYFFMKVLAISSNFKVREYPKFSYINKIMLLYSICHLIKNPSKIENKNQIYIRTNTHTHVGSRTPKKIMNYDKERKIQLIKVIEVFNAVASL